MNLVLSQCEEMQNGQLINRYGEMFIRGNNGIYFTKFLYLNFNILVFYINSATQSKTSK